MPTLLQILASVILLTLAAAPFGLSYLAWFALAPWLIAVGTAPTVRSAFFRGWLAGIAYLAMNIWWLWTATIPGTVMLIIYYGLYWGLAGAIIRALRLLAPDAEASSSRIAWRVFAVAFAWVTTEWLRCNILAGFPWMPLGATQSPSVAMCQVADLGSFYLVSFWVMLLNAWLAAWWINRQEVRRILVATIAVAVSLALVVGYGAWRMQSTVATPGPRVMIVQSNFPHLPGGAPTVEIPQAVEHFLTTLDAALSTQHADLVVLPEAAFPPLNDEARRELAKAPIGPFLESTNARLNELAKKHRTSLLVGGNTVTGWTTQGREHIGTEIRNSAYFYDPQSGAEAGRYDKIYLVPYAERPPFADGPEILRRLALTIAASRATQPLQAGDHREFAPFVLAWMEESKPRESRFISPICLENIDPLVIASMVRDPNGTGKRAEFIANLSNDGWFAVQQRNQHLQTTVFRCIENRVPMARASNTGISAFVDSCGRVTDSIPAATTSVAVQMLSFDDRVTFYTRYGDKFALLCLAITAAALVMRIAQEFISQRKSEELSNGAADSANH